MPSRLEQEYFTKMNLKSANTWLTDMINISIESFKLLLNDRGAVNGGKVRTILRAHDGRGPPEGETWFLLRGTLEPCISARPRPGFDRANFHVIIQTFRLLDIHQLVMKKIAALVETTRDRAVVAVKSVSVFSVQQQQRAVSAAEEFCFKYTQYSLP